MRRFLLLIGLLSALASFALAETGNEQVQAVSPQTQLKSKAAPDDSPDPVDAIAKSLPSLSIKTEGSSSFNRDNAAYFAFMQEPRGIMGKIELVRSQESGSPDAEAVGLLIHDQAKDIVRIEPGSYTIRALFWPRDQVFPVRYPQTATLELQSGQTATLSLSRNDYSAIHQWLRAVDEQRKRNKNVEAQDNERKDTQSPEVDFPLPAPEGQQP